MADKKKMSVAEMIAAARQMDGGEESSAAPSEPVEEAVAESAPATEPAEKSPAPPAAKPSSGGRPSVAEMLAMARGEKQPAAESKPAAKPAAKAKPEAKAKTSPKAKPAAKEKSGPKDTASILAAARSQSKPGPITKAEAAARGQKAAAKPKIQVPPMPQKPAYAKPAAAQPKVDSQRRFALAAIGTLVGSSLAVGFSALSVTAGLWTLGLARFMFPNVLREPPSRFKVGFPGEFAPGVVETKYKAQFGVWIVNGEYNGMSQLYALMSVCTHLGCTPNWLEAEQKFKCPCHGSGFYKDGINFEGPAPRPLERYAIRIADDGQVEIDKSQAFQEEMGEWEDPASYVAV